MSAVSNWRKRFDDFPLPADSVPGGRDLFELSEVEAWLERHGRLDRRGRSKQLLFQAADLLRSELSVTSVTEALGAALALVAVGRRQTESLNESSDVEAILAATVASDPDLEDVFRPLSEIDRHSVDRALALVLEVDTADLAECFEWLLSRYNRQQGISERGSGDAHIALLQALVGGEGKVIYDPAAGLGGFLTALWRAAPGRKPRLFGQEVNRAAARIARQRFLVHEIPVSMADGDTLLHDSWPELRADVVVCDPPYGVHKSWGAGTGADPRWILGRPPQITDFAWLQHAVHHLTETGRAYVFLPPSSLFGGRDSKLRRELLRGGAVEAIVGLPPGTALRTSIPLALWVLRRPGAHDRDSVLLVDATGAAPTGHAELTGKLVPRIAAVLHEWQAAGEVSERHQELAASVPVADLTAGDATAVPARWVHHELTAARREAQEVDFERTAAGSAEIRKALAARPEMAGPPGQCAAEWTSVKRLVKDGAVEIIKGARVTPEDCLPSGVPVLRMRDIAAGSDDSVQPCHVSLEGMAPIPKLTRPGDIVFSPQSGALDTFVDRHGGHVLARPLQALRVLDGSMDPEVVAAFLESPRNRRFVTGSALARVSLRDLELPLLNRRDSETLRRALRALEDEERLAGELVRSAKRLRRTLVSLASPVPAERDGDG